MILKVFYKTTIIISILFFSNNLLSANIATLNIEYIMQNNKEFNQYISEFKKTKNVIDKMIMEKEESLLIKKNEIEDLKLILNKDEVAIKIDNYHTLINDFSEKIDKINNLISANFSFNENLIVNQILEFSKQIANEKSIDIIFSENDYLLSSENIDISNNIINFLNNYNFNFKFLNDTEIQKNLF